MAKGTSDFYGNKGVNFMATRDVRLLHDSMEFVIRRFHNNKWRESVMGFVIRRFHNNKWRESVCLWCGSRDVSVELLSLCVQAGSFGVTGCFVSFRKHGCKLGIHDYCLCHFVCFSICMHVSRLVCGRCRSGRFLFGFVVADFVHR